MTRLLIPSAFAVLAGCAQLSDLSDALFTDPRAETAETQRLFDQRKTAIENQARSKRISWVESARQIRELDRSLAGRGSWVFNSHDEEYHAYCIALAGNSAAPSALSIQTRMGEEAVSLSPENRWSLWIDVEGFSDAYRSNESGALLAIGSLLESVFKIGTTIYSESPRRLFAHQFGDGLAIVSNFPEMSAERPLSIAVSVMRHLISRGVACKAAAACGGFADIGGCYPEVLYKDSSDKHIVSMGEGLMTIIPVMGTALITSHKLSQQRKGAVLLVHEGCFQSVPKEARVSLETPTTVDWIHSDFPLSREISRKAGLDYPDSATASGLLRTYISTHGKSAGEQWVSSTAKANAL